MELRAVISIVAILVALLVPVALRMLNSAKAAEGVANLRSLSAGVASFAAENDGWYPWRGLKDGPTAPANSVWWWWNSGDGKTPYAFGFTDFGRAVGSGLRDWQTYTCPVIRNNPDAFKGIRALVPPFTNIFVTYGMNTALMGKKVYGAERPSSHIVFAESYSYIVYPTISKEWLGDWQAGGKMRAAFLDGHVETLSREELTRDHATRQKYFGIN